MVPIISKHLLDGDRDRTGDALHRHQLLDPGAADVLDAAELTEKRPAPHRAQAADAVQHGGERIYLSHDSMEGDGEPVGLVADALDLVERVGIEQQPGRRALAVPDE